jgi:succinate dehydrogenase hydrophobic anchor subunit
MTRFHDRYVTREEHVRELDAVQTEAVRNAVQCLCFGFCVGCVFFAVLLILTAGHR